MEAGVKLGGRKVNSIRNEDDTTLLETRGEDIIELTKSVKEESEETGFKLNLKNTRVMSTGEQVHISTDGEEISTVRSYKLLGFSSRETATTERSKEE
jgi:hypothetical protein